ncbi:hypothetical protein [Nocardioides sp. cx-173]|uniref:hypothetical protein n=1 Tax=Nocardioides sp. cx-173 TaxID=2898796 RepID=UPI001E50CF38|nr:hypothetical protein [Nocardioides sp. cx-173]MCD4526763.1 hypothetical protein [Nocardioides sp. cx-173]UGB43869.1 hypothetical protein LQ940_10210 [Nocardioides sp. cx-173]
MDLALAVVLTARREGIDAETAQARLAEAAQRAGVTPAQLARLLVDLDQAPDPE